jgi:1-aminocyclopropane-1-carboxylate deaminase/D-cysteine desulfhydrase-like pyridoxal-dependent ACC family enzyme
MMMGLFDLIQQHHFPENTRILAIHTGGLQGKIKTY